MRNMIIGAQRESPRENPSFATRPIDALSRHLDELSRCDIIASSQRYSDRMTSRPHDVVDYSPLTHSPSFRPGAYERRRDGNDHRRLLEFVESESRGLSAEAFASFMSDAV